MPKLTLPSCVHPAPTLEPEDTPLSHEEGLALADKAIAAYKAGGSIEETLKALDTMIEATRAARASRR